MSKSSFAIGIDELQKGFQFGEKLSDLLGKVVEPFNAIWSSSLSKAKSGLIPLFKALIMMFMMYELGKTYLEGNYKELPVKVVTLSFKYCSVLLFFTGGYFFSIPADIINLMLSGGKAPNWNSISPMSEAVKIIKNVYAPWDASGAYVGKLWFEVADTVNPIMILPRIAIGSFGLILEILGYILITIGVFSIVLKAAEMTIGIPVCVLFLAGKALGVTEQYFATSMKYIISSIMDFAIILIVVKVGSTMFSSLAMDSFMDLISGVFICIIYSVLLKISPKIGSGILSGKPQVSTNDTTQILTMASVAMIAPATLAGGAAGAVSGAVNGAKDGGGLGGAMSGAKNGAASGAKNGASGAAQKMNQALS